MRRVPFGGLDSSLVTAVARSVSPDRPLTAYHRPLRRTSYDEGDVASRAALELARLLEAGELAPADVRGEIEKLVSVSGRAAGRPRVDAGVDALAPGGR